MPKTLPLSAQGSKLFIVTMNESNVNQRECSVDGCGRKKRSKGFCNMHYLRWKKYGDPGEPEVRCGKSENERIYIGYRPHILERDDHSCVLCKSQNPLHVHHIITRGAGGKDHYANLITLCAGCHREKAHGPDNARYRERFLQYTSAFVEPDFWNEILEKSKRDKRRLRETRKRHMQSYFASLKNQPQRLQVYKRKRASEWQRLKQYYLDTYGVTFGQYRYRIKMGYEFEDGQWVYRPNEEAKRYRKERRKKWRQAYERKKKESP